MLCPDRKPSLHSLRVRCPSIWGVLSLQKKKKEVNLIIKSSAYGCIETGTELVIQRRTSRPATTVRALQKYVLRGHNERDNLFISTLLLLLFFFSFTFTPAWNESIAKLRLLTRYVHWITILYACSTLLRIIQLSWNFFRARNTLLRLIPKRSIFNTARLQCRKNDWFFKSQPNAVQKFEVDICRNHLIYFRTSVWNA